MAAHCGDPGELWGGTVPPWSLPVSPPVPRQVEFRIIVQVLNENDNRPHFQGATVLTHNVSEVTVALWAQAGDRAGDRGGHGRGHGDGAGMGTRTGIAVGMDWGRGQERG